MSTPSTPEQGWNITASCDIKLGKLFAEHPELSEVAIDPVAAQTALQTLGPGSSGELHLLATHDDHMARAGHSPGLAYRTSDGITHLQIAVGGGLASTYHNKEVYLGIMKQARQQVSDSDQTYEDPGIYMTAIAQKIARKLSVIPDAAHIQEVAVHELQHAVDYDDDALVERHHKYKKIYDKFTNVLVVGSVLAPLAIAGAVGAEVGRRKTLKHGLVAGAASLAATWSGRIPAAVTLGKSAFEHLPMEERANNAMRAHAGSLPQIVDIH